MNLYGFVGNDGVGRIDVLGMFKDYIDCSFNDELKIRLAERRAIIALENFIDLILDYPNEDCLFYEWMEEVNLMPREQALRVYSGQARVAKSKAKKILDSLKTNMRQAQCENRWNPKDRSISATVAVNGFLDVFGIRINHDNEIHFWSKFFTESDQEQASTVVHEMSHMELGTGEDYDWYGAVDGLEDALGYGQFWQQVGEKCSTEDSTKVIIETWVKSALTGNLW